MGCNEMLVTDIWDSGLLKMFPELLDKLLYDNTTKKNIIWATSNYEKRGKEYLPNKEMRPKIFQVKKSGTLVLDDLLVLRYDTLDKGSIIAFINNSANILHIKNKDKHVENSKITKLDVKNKELVIEGLCFFKIVGNMTLEIEINKDTLVYTRDSLID